MQNVGELPQDVECLQRTPAESKAVSEVFTCAFSGSASNEPELGFDWCLGPDLQGKGWDDPRRHSSLAWIFRFLVEDVFASRSGGAVLVCRTANGAIGGAAALKIHRAKPHTGVRTMITAGWRAGQPSSDAAKYTFSNPRMVAFEGAQERLHNAHALGPHLYVWALAVDPSAQGQGIGGKLMRAAVSIADREGLACYLETCGMSNPKIYAKYGFSVVGQEEVSTKFKKGAEADIFEHPLLAMVRARPAQAVTVKSEREQGMG